MTGTPRSYFERVYARDEDPWGFAHRWYERRKYAATLAALPAERYRRAFEPGCSIGVLTELLAGRCDEILAVDLLQRPVDAARERTRALPNVTVEQRSLPEQWPPGPFDLLILSEFAYYFDADRLDELLAAASSSLADRATVVAVHYRGATDYPLSGDEVHARLAAVRGWRGLVSHREEMFNLDVWRLDR
jgi:trans-aconitate methyltransferase